MTSLRGGATAPGDTSEGVTPWWVFFVWLNFINLEGGERKEVVTMTKKRSSVFLGKNRVTPLVAAPLSDNNLSDATVYRAASCLNVAYSAFKFKLIQCCQVTK